MFNTDLWFEKEINAERGKTQVDFIVKNYTHYTINSINFFYNNDEVEVNVFCPAVQEAEIQNGMTVNHNSVLVVKKLRVCASHGNSKIIMTSSNEMSAIYSKKRKSVTIKVEVSWEGDSNGIPIPVVKANYNAVK